MRCGREAPYARTMSFPTPPGSTGDGSATLAAKRTLRGAVRLSRVSRTATVRAEDDHRRSVLVMEALEPVVDRLDTVAAYLSADAEPGSLELVAWLASRGVEVLLPALTAADGGLLREPAWAPYGGPDRLRMGRRSILEPTTPPVDRVPARMGLVVCPAVAVDLTGARLGRGGGWYDRVLATLDPAVVVWTLLNDDEVLSSVPTDPWDRPVDVIATPTRLLVCEPEPTA